MVRCRYDRRKLDSFLIGAHVVWVPAFVFSIKDLHGLLCIVQSNLVLAHIRVDGADVDVALREVRLLGLAVHHLLLNLHNLLEVANRDVFFGVLLVVHAEVVVSHGQASARFYVLRHRSKLISIEQPCSFQLVAKRFSVVENLASALTFLSLQVREASSVGLYDLLDHGLYLVCQVFWRRCSLF